MKRLIPFLLTLIGGAALPCVARAGELRVLDTNGLIRITTDVASAVTVTIRSAETLSAESIVLSNSNGLSADISAEQTGPSSISFSKVPEGIWKIDAHGKSLPITKIDVQ